MSEAERQLRLSSVEVALEHPTGADAQHCLDQYFRELGARFEGGFNHQVDGTNDLAGFVPPGGCFLIARVLAKPVGCGGLRTFEPGVGEIKRMWVSNEARGLGIGRKILQALEQEALRSGLRTVRLDTNKVLTEALRLYPSCGYREIAPFNDNPYAHHWFEKDLGGEN